MKSFRDTKNRQWSFSITVSSIKRVRALVNVDLPGLIDGGMEGLGKLLGDPIQFVDVIYCLCKPGLDSANVSDEEFGESMGGDSIGSAADAFLEEFSDFFPDPRVRTGLKRVIEAGRTMQQKLMNHLDIQLEKMNPEAEANKLIDSFGSVRESSESTPDPSPSENST